MLEYAKKGLPDGYTFYDDPKRKQKALASEGRRRAGQLLEFAGATTQLGEEGHGKALPVGQGGPSRRRTATFGRSSNEEV